MKNVIRKIHTIDATDKAIGRLATEAVRLLSGKHKVEYVPYLDQGDIVVVKNLEKVKITGQKLTQKKYYHYSGYPGGMKTRTMGKIFVKNPQDVLHRAVYNMLPKNQLRRGMIKRLKFI